MVRATGLAAAEHSAELSRTRHSLYDEATPYIFSGDGRRLETYVHAAYDIPYDCLEPLRMTSLGPLAGITIVDLTRVLAGPYCTMMLCDLGARVIKVERPGVGDDSRHIGPFIEEKSAYFISLNRGKESIALDLKAVEDRALFEGLLEHADILIENYRPGTMDKLGYSFDDLHARFPRLIYAQISGFGDTGPLRERPAYDLVVQAMGGVMSLTGQPGGSPTRVGTSVGDLAAGMFACAGINAALFQREKTGTASKIDVSMLDSQVAILENAIARYQATGEIPTALGSRHPSITPFDSFKTQDGNLVIAAGNDGLFRALCKCIGREELFTNPDYESNASRTANQEELKRTLEETLQTKATKAWLGILAEAKVPSGPIQNVAEVLEHPQTLARNMVVQVDEPGLENFRVAGNPIKISGVEDPSSRAAAPELDANREALIREFGL